jgi:hypothetical protein
MSVAATEPAGLDQTKMSGVAVFEVEDVVGGLTIFLVLGCLWGCTY